MLIKRLLDFVKQPCFLDLSKYIMVKFYKCIAATKCLYDVWSNFLINVCTRHESWILNFFLDVWASSNFSYIAKV